MLRQNKHIQGFQQTLDFFMIFTFSRKCDLSVSAKKSDSNYLPTGPDSSSGRTSASGVGGRGFNTWPRHNEGVKMVPVVTLLGAQQYKASTGSPLTHNLQCTITNQT